MTDPYAVDDTSQIVSPAMLVFRDQMLANVDQMIQIARDPARLRPHCKTHKMEAVARLQHERGITKHKAATFAEAEMLARAGVTDILLAYNLVGPNIDRAVRFTTAYPDVRLIVTADHPAPLKQLSSALAAADLEIGMLLDIDTGQHRTGLPVGPEARQLYELMHELQGIRCEGFHVYDGHQHQSDPAERQRAIDLEWKQVMAFRDELERDGFPVPRVVAGGTGSFPIYAAKEVPGLECSPGTCVFHDVGYGTMFADLPFTPAAVLLTRVVSRPTPNRITLDLGYKACASDPPAGKRLKFPALPDAREVLQNEEHLVLETSAAGNYEPGDELVAIPRHVCPTSALQSLVWVIADGKIVDQWPVTARDRWLTI